MAIENLKQLIGYSFNKTLIGKKSTDEIISLPINHVASSLMLRW